jgi:itaconate CoA-transferase
MNDQLPFEGLRVIALEQAVAGPFCTRQFADLGADVIKIERPDGGDFSRGYDRAIGGISAYFAWLNRGKRSVALDVKSEAGRRALGKLLEHADVFLHNLAPGAVERLGFGYDELSRTHPRLVWVGISGYGPDGPYRDKRAYDMLIQAESGVVSLTGSAAEGARVGVAIADIASGFYAYSSALAALWKRERTGRGERIDISMLECLTEWAMPQLYVYLGTGVAPARAGQRHSMIFPYGTFRCADGDVVLSVQNEREWHRFCTTVMEDTRLATQAEYQSNEKRLENRKPLEQAIEALFARHSVATMVERLDRAEVANAVVNDMARVATHPQLQARQRWADVETFLGPIAALRPPHNLSQVEPRLGKVPAVGEHTLEVFTEFGLST